MGRLNRILEIQDKVVQRDAFGSEIAIWQQVAKVWYELLETRPLEKFEQESNRLLNISTATFRILAPRVDVDETMRILDDQGTLWDIIGLISNDRQFLIIEVGHTA